MVDLGKCECGNEQVEVWAHWRDCEIETYNSQGVPIARREESVRVVQRTPRCSVCKRDRYGLEYRNGHVERLALTTAEEE